MIFCCRFPEKKRKYLPINRSEKMLGSIASGKWVLHPTFMSTSMRSGKLAEFARFEWGNPDNGFLDAKMSDLEKSLAAASYRTRRKREEGGERGSRETGAFAGFRAIMHTSESRVDAFKRLIELGGGKVVEAQPPYSNPGEATHMLAEPSRLPGIKVDYRALATAGVAVVTPLYLNEYLVTDPPPKVDRFIIEEFRSFWKNRLKP